ncbi:MAG: hypothetical protein KJ056_05050 [Acidimicrobiia bacterium]|nr:hypothetical protein [Acidimicrobiia bacterium]
MQLIQADAGSRRWPTELRSIEPRYSDVPTVELTVPARPAFVAMKAAAWREQLAHQCLLRIDAESALEAVRGAWTRAAGW